MPTGTQASSSSTTSSSTVSTSSPTTITNGIIAPYGLTINLFNANVPIGGNVILRAAWSGGPSQYSLYVYSGTLASCVSDINNVASYQYSAASNYYITLYPTASAYYCYKVLDSANNYAYSQTSYVHVIGPTTASTTTTIPANTITATANAYTTSATTVHTTIVNPTAYPNTISANAITNPTTSTSYTTTISATSPSNLTISLVAGITATSTGGGATIRASWSGSSKPFRMYVLSGASASCAADTKPVAYYNFTASPAYVSVYPNASAYYCYKLIDSSGAYGYSPTQYINVPYICAPPSTYNSTTKSCAYSNFVISASNSLQPNLQSVSNSVGISANALLALSTTSNSAIIKCAGCTGTANNTQGITTISTTSSAASLASIVSTNSILLNKFVGNSTPEGFSAINSTITASNQTTGTLNSVDIEWSSSSAVGSKNISVSSIKGMAANQSSITPSQLSAQYVLNYMPNASSISVTTHTEVHASAVIRGNNGTTQYVPSNVTVYGSRGNAAVVSVTNLVRNSSNYVNTTSTSKISLNSMVVVPRKNITALAAGITFYGSVVASNAVSAAIASKTNAGNVISVMVINSSVNDSLIKAVQYGFNVSKRLLAAKNVNPKEIRLYRQNVSAGKWSALPTNFTGSNATQYFYSATSPGMSIYAIGFGYLESNLTQTNSTNILPAATPQKTILDPLVMTAVLLLVVAAMIVYLALFRKGRSDLPPASGTSQFETPKNTEEAINNYIDQESS